MAFRPNERIRYDPATRNVTIYPYTYRKGASNGGQKEREKRLQNVCCSIGRKAGSLHT